MHNCDTELYGNGRYSTIDKAAVVVNEEFSPFLPNTTDVARPCSVTASYLFPATLNSKLVDLLSHRYVLLVGPCCPGTCWYLRTVVPSHPRLFGRFPASSQW
jgi:hypothetical protein